MTKSPEEIRREAEATLAECRLITGAPEIKFPDPLVRYRQEAEADAQADREARERRVRRAERDRQRAQAITRGDVIELINAAHEMERDGLCQAVGGAVGQLLEQRIGPIQAKLDHLDRLLARLEGALALPMSLPEERRPAKTN